MAKTGHYLISLPILDGYIILKLLLQKSNTKDTQKDPGFTRWFVEIQPGPQKKLRFRSNKNPPCLHSCFKLEIAVQGAGDKAVEFPQILAPRIWNYLHLQQVFPPLLSTS